MKISVIVPAYNCEKYISKCLDSLLNQLYKDFEIIFVDDGSTDKTLDIARYYKSKYKNLKVYTQLHKGSAAARNLALQNVLGQYIAFVDADDFVSPWFLKTLIDCAKKYNCDIAQCLIKKVNQNDPIDNISASAKIKTFSKKDVLSKFCCSTNSVNMTSLCNKLFKSSLFKTISFNDGMLYDDEQAIHKLYYNANKVVFVDEPLYYYQQTVNSQMRKPLSKQIVQKIDIVENQIKFFKSYNEQKFANMLQIKYYITVFWVLDKLKKEFPNETSLIENVRLKTYGWIKTIFVFGPKIADKLYLIKKAIR